MDTETLESLLQGSGETDTLEFKAAMSWECRSLVRDMLAMSNVIDGGRIIVGVADRTLERQGLSEEQIATYVSDTMKDQIAPFADPRIAFSCEVVSDRKGRKYIVIEVSSFDDVPVICKRDGHDVKAGDIYYRSRTRRPESARVNNSADMRDIIETSAARSLRRLRRLGYAPVEVAGPDYDAELEDLK